MTPTDLLLPLAMVLNLLTLVFCFAALRSFHQACPAVPHWQSRLVLLPMLVWALAWLVIPALEDIRRQVPASLPVSILIPMVYASLAFPALARRAGGPANPQAFLALAPWRVVFGAMLLITGLCGGLPVQFYVSAGLGDIAVGLAGLWLRYHPKPSPRAIRVWTWAGLADLTHVLILGAIYLFPFFSENPHLPLVGMLPLLGVPLFVALHVTTLRLLQPT